ncbi:Harbinger transposase-derived nuclease domain [Cinara cedri]|uniref:Harbinger transposase-derived nuclease domain n=1 Tax=Cinara cedri TaxID=506608 RepID=A0A5E4NQN9_9HEMI|nr:Harbinger transposase-derived nuclease domain [Cinara cedri]
MPSDVLNAEKSVIAGQNKLSPYVFVAEDAFPLSPCILKPYSGHQNKGSKNRTFNYRLSRTRRVVENVFGTIALIFRVFRKPMLLQPENVEKAVLACVYLHNYLRKSSLSKKRYTPPGAFDSEQLDTGTIERET